MTNKEKEELIKELQKSFEIISILDKVKNKLTFVKMLKLADDLSDDKKEIVYDYVVNNYNVYGDDACLNLKDDKDKTLLINILVKYNQINIAYYAMKYMENPKNLSSDIILSILNEFDVVTIVKDFGILFIDELFEREDYYNMLKLKDKLPGFVIKRIYKKIFLSIEDYSCANYFLTKEEKQEFTKVFVEEKSDNGYIANEILKNKDYKKEDYEKLLHIVTVHAKADVIYDVLMRENLSNNQRNKLEKALLDTRDMEYITYYYFFKKIDEFKLLFGSALLFLAYVQMNKEKFKNNEILKYVIDKIKEENNEVFSSKIESKVGVSYTKKPKKDVK